MKDIQKALSKGKDGYDILEESRGKEEIKKMK